MSGPGDSSSAALGAIAALGVLAATAWWVERQRAATQRAGQPEEVALHEAALTAVDQARTQIHLARRAAEALGQYSVAFDVQKKLASAFTEELPPMVEPPAEKTDRRKLFFMVDSREHLPALKAAVDRLVLPPPPSRLATDEPPQARPLLRQAIDAVGGQWDANRALTMLKRHGWNSGSQRPLNVVGNLLAAMSRDGEIKRADRGMYASLREPLSPTAENQVAPGLFATEASPGVLIISGVEPTADVPEAA